MPPAIRDYASGSRWCKLTGVNPVDGPLRGHEAVILLRHGRTEVYTAVNSLLDRLLAGRVQVVAADPPGLLVHRVSAEGPVDDTDCWLTWELSALTAEGWTQVRLIHDEADTSGAPPPDLDGMLALLDDDIQGEDTTDFTAAEQ